jgi:hypothetical protein
MLSPVDFYRNAYDANGGNRVTPANLIVWRGFHVVWFNDLSKNQII